MSDPADQPWVPYPLRELRRATAEREAAGEGLWTEWPDPTTRNKLAACVRDQLWDDMQSANVRTLLNAITQAVSDAAGVVNRATEVPELFGRLDVDDFVDSIRQPDQLPAVIFGLIEGVWRWQTVLDEEFIARGPHSRQLFQDKIAEILEDHRIGFVFVGGNFLPRSGSIADQEILVPTVKFLTGDQAFADADSTYREALKADPARPSRRSHHQGMHSAAIGIGCTRLRATAPTSSHKAICSRDRQWDSWRSTTSRWRAG